jgi:hypothetical protein
MHSALLIDVVQNSLLTKKIRQLDYQYHKLKFELLDRRLCRQVQGGRAFRQIHNLIY